MLEWIAEHRNLVVLFAGGVASALAVRAGQREVATASDGWKYLSYSGGVRALAVVGASIFNGLSVAKGATLVAELGWLLPAWIFFCVTSIWFLHDALAVRIRWNARRIERASLLRRPRAIAFDELRAVIDHDWLGYIELRGPTSRIWLSAARRGVRSVEREAHSALVARERRTSRPAPPRVAMGADDEPE